MVYRKYLRLQGILSKFQVMNNNQLLWFFFKDVSETTVYSHMSYIF